MTRYFDLDEANGALAEAQPILLALREERAELILLRDRAMATTPGGPAGAESSTSEPRGRDESPGQPGGTPVDGVPIPELEGDDLRLLRLRMQGLVDQMQAGVARLDELGIVLREIETGLIDLAALAPGRPIWLCWRIGDGDRIAWWHEHGAGFAGRRRLEDLS
jgi:hypothetical protein